MAVQPIERSHAIPVRLLMKERKLQRLMRGVLLTSSYTDKVDTEARAKNPTQRSMIIAKEVVKAIGGMALGLNLERGSKLIVEKDFHDRAQQEQLAASIEVARRYKIMNPDLLRTDYVKFLYLVQDAVQNQPCREALGFHPVIPVLTVKRRAEELDVSGLLEDDRLPCCITPVPKIRDRNSLNRALRYKDALVSRVCKDWAAKSSAGASPDDVELLVRSLNDANTFSDANSESARALMELLQKHFKPEEEPECDAFSLAISEGSGGSRLTHKHTMQYNFVLQSLALWKNVSDRMFELWMVAEGDLLREDAPYELRSTGQGLQRVQPAPNLYKAMSEILAATKRELGTWVGSERIHMGDNQVPNAFHFIDKYAQISRIIVPVLRVIEMLEPDAKRSESVDQYLKTVFKSPEAAQKTILADFFRHAFDGSGGDNMDDAGSCIDGRLTSAWNWCNQIRTKSYYPVFMMAGFSSFDGDLTV